MQVLRVFAVDSLKIGQVTQGRVWLEEMGSCGPHKAQLQRYYAGLNPRGSAPWNWGDHLTIEEEELGMFLNRIMIACRCLYSAHVHADVEEELVFLRRQDRMLELAEEVEEIGVRSYTCFPDLILAHSLVNWKDQTNV